MNDEIESENDESIIDKDKKKELGLYTIKNVFEENIDEEKTKFFYGSLRSGQRVEYDGNLVIIGDVNSGAEVFATGNIAIVGMLRGIAHAGATGNKKAKISAMGIDTPQIRIANIVKEMPEINELKRGTIMIIGEDVILEA